MNKWIIITADIFGALTIWQALSWGICSHYLIRSSQQLCDKAHYTKEELKLRELSSLSSATEVGNRHVPLLSTGEGKWPWSGNCRTLGHRELVAGQKVNVACFHLKGCQVVFAGLISPGQQMDSSCPLCPWGQF